MIMFFWLGDRSTAQAGSRPNKYHPSQVETEAGTSGVIPVLPFVSKGAQGGFRTVNLPTGLGPHIYEGDGGALLLSRGNVKVGLDSHRGRYSFELFVASQDALEVEIAEKAFSKNAYFY